MNHPTRHLLRLLAILILLVPAPAVAGDETSPPKAADLVQDGQGIDLTSPRYHGLFKELRLRHQFDQEELERLFRDAVISRRVLELMDTQWEAQPYYRYYPRFITAQTIRDGKRLLAEHRELLDRVEREIGVEREVVVAIWGIETRFGAVEGGFNVFRTLNTLFDAYPRRRDFARTQLIEFLLLCRENGVDPLTVKGSYAGAFGQTQFIPSSFRAYAVDFNQDGRIDVWQSTEDILASIANYLHRFGWVFRTPVYRELGPELKDPRLQAAFEAGRKAKVEWQAVRSAQQVELPAPPGDQELTIVGLEVDDKGAMRYIAGYPNFQAITAWNNSNRYAMAVTELAEQLAR